MNFDVADNVRAALLAIFGVLALASVVVAGMARARREKDFTELKLRVRTWWYIFLVF